jgi:hypothetical protein
MMRFRPRFSVRTLAIVVTLACAYFGSWPLTKKYGLPSRTTDGMYVDPFRPIWASTEEPSVLAPLLVRYATWNQESNSSCYRYYLWMFGPKIQLPFWTPHTQSFYRQTIPSPAPLSEDPLFYDVPTAPPADAPRMSSVGARTNLRITEHSTWCERASRWFF